jgi:V/A-type H+-transporting ATPase subunit C
VEPLIGAELAAVHTLIEEIAPQPGLTRLFALPTDAHNLKALCKARMLGSSADDILLEGGAFPAELLKKCVETGDYASLPPALSAGMAEAQKAMAVADSQLVSAAVDKAVFSYILTVLKKYRDGFLNRHFRAQIDFINVQSLVRAHLLKMGADKLHPLLLPGGEIDEKELLAALELPVEQWPRVLSRGKNGGRSSRRWKSSFPPALGNAGTTDGRSPFDAG